MLTFPWIVKKNYTLRWRRLLLYGGQSYRTILLTFAWLFQARPLYIAVFYAGMWSISKVALQSPMKRQVDPMEIWRDLRQGGSTLNAPIPHLILLCLSNICMGASSWRMVLSGFTISLWWLNYHFEENYCKAISPPLSMILAWEWAWFDFVIFTYGEAMKPTFGDDDDSNDIKMPADGDCVYHSFNYAMSDGTAALTRQLATRLRSRVVAAIRRDGLFEQAARLLHKAMRAIQTSRNISMPYTGFPFECARHYVGAPRLWI